LRRTRVPYYIIRKTTSFTRFEFDYFAVSVLIATRFYEDQARNFLLRDKKRQYSARTFAAEEYILFFITRRYKVSLASRIEWRMSDSTASEIAKLLRFLQSMELFSLSFLHGNASCQTPESICGRCVRIFYTLRLSNRKASLSLRSNKHASLPDYGTLFYPCLRATARQLTRLIRDNCISHETRNFPREPSLICANSAFIRNQTSTLSKKQCWIIIDVNTHLYRNLLWRKLKLESISLKICWW